MKQLLIFALLAACSTAKASEPTPTPAPVRNLAVEGVKIIDAKLVCAPQYTDAGEHHMHSCVVADKQIVCAVNDTTIGLVCGPLVPKQVEKAPEPTPAPAAKVEAPKKK